MFGNHDLEFEDVDYLIKRDWALYVEDIDDLLWTIRQDVFEQVLENRTAYPWRVRELLDWYARDGTNKVKDLTDDEMNGDDETRIRKEKEEFEVYIPPERPRNIIDERNDELRHELETYKRRKNIDILKLKNLENELEESNKRLSSENRYWKELQWISAKFVGGRHISL